MTVEELRIVISPNNKYLRIRCCICGTVFQQRGPQAGLADEHWRQIAGGGICPDCLRTLDSAGPEALASQLEKMASVYEADIKRDMQERLDALTAWATRLRQTAVTIRRTEKSSLASSGDAEDPSADEVGADDDTDPVVF
jgi:hypothetical protein